MKVKEAVKILLGCNPEFDLAYEHCYVDYINQSDQEKLVEMGDLRPLGYTRWRSLEKWRPEEIDFPILLAHKNKKGKYAYTLELDFNHFSLFSQPGALWMPLELTIEDKYRRMGLSDEQIETLIKSDK